MAWVRCSCSPRKTSHLDDSEKSVQKYMWVAIFFMKMTFYFIGNERREQRAELHE